MFAVPGLLAVILVDYLRPQEYFPALSGVPLLHLATGLALLGFVVDLRLGLTRVQAAPHLLLTILFFTWCLVTVVVRAPAQLPSRASALLIPFAVYLLVAHAVQGFRMLQAICAVLLAICIALAALGIHQGLAPYGCHRGSMIAGNLEFIYDGRPCTPETSAQCEAEGSEPGADYACEKIGLLGTSSTHGRARYRGTLADPNELALALSIGLPLALGFADRRRSVARVALALLAAGLIGVCAYFTESRGGQLVLLTVLGVYFVKLVGAWRGGVVGLLLALPLLLLGGRSGGESSTKERIECWWVGLHLVVASPGFGVGSGQFLEHHSLTAHNSYILAASELGLPGLLLWTSVVYVAIKIPIQVLSAPVAPVARSWALSLLASMAGLIVGILFLSYVYKDVLWIYVGMTGVLYQAIKRHNPGFTVRFGVRDLGLVALIDAALVLSLVGYTGLKMGW